MCPFFRTKIAISVLKKGQAAFFSKKRNQRVVREAVRMVTVGEMM